MDTRWDVAKHVQTLFQALPEVVSISLKGSLQSGTYDDFSDIDLVIDVSGSDDAAFARTVYCRMESAFHLHFYDWAPSLLPEKFVQTFYIRDLPVFWNLDIEITATPHYATLHRSDIVRDPTAAHLKLWALNTKYCLRGKPGIHGEIAKLHHRVLGRPAPGESTSDQLLLMIINHLHDNSPQCYQDFITKCLETHRYYFAVSA